MKRKVCILLLTTIAITLSACGSKGTQSNSSIAESLEAKEDIEIESSSIGSEESKPQGVDEKLEDDEYSGIIEDGVFVIENCISTNNEIVVPDEINGVPVGKIADNAFYSLTCRSIILPDTVTYIGENAFLACESLEQIELGKGLKSIGMGAFSGCLVLKSVTFPEGMETIENPLFINNNELEEVLIPGSVVNLPERIASNKTCPKIVIVTPAGSEAEKVALAQGLTVRNS